MPTFNNASSEEMKQILSSDQFILIPSDCENEFKIHRWLLKSLSPAFQSTSEGGWAETESGKHKFLSSDRGQEAVVSEKVVTCFIAWAYTGDYMTENVDVSSTFVGTIVQTGKTGSSRVIRFVKAEEMGAYSTGNKTKSQKQIADHSNYAAIEQTEDSQAVQDTGASPIHVLLLNVQIYTFATIYLIQPLKVAAHQKINDYLQQIEPMVNYYGREGPQRGERYKLDSMWEMLEYATVHLSEDDELLDWLARYTSSKIDLFRKEMKRWSAVLGRDDGKFARLMLKYMMPNTTSPLGHLPKLVDGQMVSLQGQEALQDDF